MNAPADIPPLDLMDRYYLAKGPCCAGCDFWRSETPRWGRCTRGAPIERGIVFDLGGDGCHEMLLTYPRTVRSWWCGGFRDAFDWTLLGVPLPPWRKQSPDPTDPPF